MHDAPPAEVLVVAAPSQDGRASRIIERLEERGLHAKRWPDDDDGADPARSLARAGKAAAAIVLLADGSFAAGKIGAPEELVPALVKLTDKLLLVAVDRAALAPLVDLRADVLPARGGLAELDEGAARDVERHVAHEVLAEVDRSHAPERTDAFDEYRLLFDSTERLVERRRGTTQTFLTVNAGLSAVVAFLVKDLALEGARLALVTIPLFLIGVLACRLWKRTILQYEALVDWRYRQLRRMERRRFVGSYRLFTREWEGLYAPRAKKRFGFSELEATVPTTFLALYALGLLFALASLAGLLDRLLP
ncbi:RipA family octameric membrane protein [Polyangium spumosum]|uniref:Uncharacterized protein n=1 Tax=Polyangium spumosum TaxID=889282 RepID=A0A6N7PYW4_9BACT|nr:hypothetical protein [Polyangium spumosum]MRG95475.1 hypothetical protein [Polyangium spumosum]